MLDVDSRPGEIAKWIYALPCRVQLPAKLREEFEKNGVGGLPSDDVRRHRRIYCRGEKHRAALELRQTMPALARERAWHGVYTNDFSKQGCSLLHSGNLYPGERFRLILLTGVERTIEVAWCRRLDKSCFQVGTQFVESGTPPEAGANSLYKESPQHA
jgi:hypothetical protein